MSKAINIKLEGNELRDVLVTCLKNEQNHKLIAEALLGLIEYDDDRTKLFKACHGVGPEINFSIGDRVRVRKENISSYHIDWEGTKAAGLCSEDFIVGTITKIKRWDTEPFTVELKGVKDGKRKTFRHTTPGRTLQQYEVFAGDHDPAMDVTNQAADGNEDMPF